MSDRQGHEEQYRHTASLTRLMSAFHPLLPLATDGSRLIADIDCSRAPRRCIKYSSRRKRPGRTRFIDLF